MDKDEIKMYEKIFNGPNRYLMLGSLISADFLYVKEDYQNKLNIVKNIKENIDDMNIDNKEEIVEYINKAEEILTYELSVLKD